MRRINVYSRVNLTDSRWRGHEPGESACGGLTCLPHGDKVVGILGSGGVFGIEFEVVVHALMDHCEVIGGFTGIAITTCLFAAFEFGETTMQGHHIDVEAVEA